MFAVIVGQDAFEPAAENDRGPRGVQSSPTVPTIDLPVTRRNGTFEFLLTHIQKYTSPASTSCMRVIATWNNFSA